MEPHSTATPASAAPPLVPPAHAAPAGNGQGHSAKPPTPQHAEDEIPHDLHRPHLLMVIAVVILFVGVLAGLFVVGRVPHDKVRAQAEGDANEQKEMITSVTVAKPKRSEAAHTVSLPCDIRPYQETLVYPRTTGYLKKLYVDIQDRVEAGQLLAEIDSPEVDAELDQARASVLQSQANVTKGQSDLDLAQRTLDRYANIQGTSVTPQERDEKLAARDQAAAALVQAKANVVVAQANVERLVVMQGFEKITAPFSGTVTLRNYDVGALLTASESGVGRELFRITQATTLRVFVNMPQIESSDIKEGQVAKLAVRNFPGKEFTGSVSRLADAIDPATRTMPLELDFPNPNGELFAGMYGEVRLDVAESSPSLRVPTSALVFNAGGAQVALVRDGKVHFQKVTVGRDLGTELEISTGITGDDRIIVNPGERLAEGVDVQTVDLDKPKVAIATP